MFDGHLIYFCLMITMPESQLLNVAQRALDRVNDVISYNQQMRGIRALKMENEGILEIILAMNNVFFYE